MRIPDPIENVLIFCESKPGLMLLGILLLSFILRFPSLTEPAWYGDEGITFTQAQTIRNGLSMYKDVYDNKPPLSYSLAALSFSVLGESQWSARFVLMLWAIATQITFFILARKLFGIKPALIASLLFALAISTPYLEGNIYNGEILMIMPVMLGILLGLRNKLWLAGIFFSTGFLLKVPALFEFIGFLAFLWIESKGLVTIELVKKYLWLLLGFIVMILLVSTPFVLNKTFDSYLNSAFLNNVGYTDTYNNFIIPNGLLVLKALPVAALVFGLKLVRQLKELRGEVKLLLLWLALGLFGALLSGRPYTHYLIQILPPFTLLVSLVLVGWLGKMRLDVVAFQERMTLTIATIATVLVALCCFTTQSIGLDYYPNYIRYMTGSMDVESYQKSFDQKVTRNYILAEFIKERTTESDRILVLANEPFVYFLSNRFPTTRYSTFYHLNLVQGAFEDTRNSLLKREPKIVIRGTGNEFNDQSMNQSLANEYHLIGAFDDAQIYIRNMP
ncbi:hypothetical protein BH10PSE19_BH10PSE19_22390 [soil metagenome]